MIREMDRELKVSGITVPVNHYQNQELSGDDRLTKELIGVSFVISKPYLGKREMLDFMFKDEAELIEKYCRAELSDRLDRNGNLYYRIWGAVAVKSFGRAVFKYPGRGRGRVIGRVRKT